MSLAQEGILICPADMKPCTCQCHDQRMCAELGIAPYKAYTMSMYSDKHVQLSFKYQNWISYSRLEAKEDD